MYVCSICGTRVSFISDTVGTCRIPGSLFGTASRSDCIHTSRHLFIDETAGRMSDSIIVTNISGSGGISPIILGLFEYFQVCYLSVVLCLLISRSITVCSFF